MRLSRRSLPFQHLLLFTCCCCIVILIFTLCGYVLLGRETEALTTSTSSSSGEVKQRIQIIYFASLRPIKWRYIVFPQMKDLYATKIMDSEDSGVVVDLLVVLHSETQELLDEATRGILDIFSSSPTTTQVQFQYAKENLFEYHGIKALYDSSVASREHDPDKIFLYFHSRGMYYHGDDTKRCQQEKTIFDVVVKPWTKVLEIFRTKPDVNKVCFGCSPSGYGWYNFFWVRGAYLRECSPPVVTSDRFYYESYIADEHKSYTSSPSDCYNLVKENKVPFFERGEIIDELFEIMRSDEK